MQGTIKGCSNYGDIGSNATSQARIGGIAGYSDGGSIIGCSNYGKISGAWKVIGGIAETQTIVARLQIAGTAAKLMGLEMVIAWEESWEKVLVGPLPAAQTQGRSQGNLSGE
jgi:hypothetical protein